MIDTHAHVHFNAYKDDMDEVIQRSLERGVIMNLVGTQKDTSKKGVEVAQRYEGAYASIGLHPEHLFSKYVDEAEWPFRSREEEFDYNYYKELAQQPKVIGIGECGLDLYRIPNGMTAEQMLPKQKEVFLQHIKLAKEVDLPLVVHCRDPVVETPFHYQASAHEHLIDILKGEAAKSVRGTIHCYTSDWNNAQQYLDLGFYIGFTGVITFPPQKKNPQAQEDLLEVVRRMPLDRILLETDCPYLSPIPYRGKRGEPWMVEETARKIGELRQISINEALATTTENALRLFDKIR